MAQVSLRRGATLLLVLAIVLPAAACGDPPVKFPPELTGQDLGPADTTTTTGTGPGDTTAGTTTTTGVATYPARLVNIFLDDCHGEGIGRELCACAIDGLQARVPLDDFLEVAAEREVADLFALEGGMGSAAAVSGVIDSCRGEIVGPMTLDDQVTAAIADLTAYWEQQLPAIYGIDYREVSDAFPYYPSTRDVPECGPEPIDPEVYFDNAFYCRPGDYIAWDAEGLFPSLWTEFGDFTVAMVLAHEWGHAVQARADVTGLTIMTELQADCFAGAWADHIARGEGLLRLNPGDLEEAMAGYLVFRDPPGTSLSDPAAHGSAFDRVNAFRDGFFNGPEQCRGYEQGGYLVADIPLTQADLITGGDLPFAEAAPLLSQSLEAYWALVFPEVFGIPWEPVEGFPYLPASGVFPPDCGDPGAGAPDGTAYYCETGDFVTWDQETLFPGLYQSIGDFAVGMVLGHEWATAAQAKAGLPTAGEEAELQADCMSGAWAAALVPFDNPTGIVLSSGDLDEGIAGFLTLGDDPGSGTMERGTAFERFDAFQQGFFNGTRGCLGS